MKTLTDYFKDTSWKAKYQIGDRVRGRWNGVPFTGSVAINTMINEEEGPYVVVFLDLPIKWNEKIHTIVKVDLEDIMGANGKYGFNSKTDSKK